MSRYHQKNEDGVLFSLVLGAYLVLFCVILTICGLLFDYSLWAVFDKDIPWYMDALCGLLLGPVNAPLAIILFILVGFGVVIPPLF